MAPNGTIRRAIGVVKDQTRISIAKISSNFDSELDILIVKVTTHDDIVPNERLFDDIIRRSSTSKELVSECIGLIYKRIERTKDWIVGLKCLILVHRVMIYGGETFLNELVYVYAGNNVKIGGILRKMCEFKDEAHFDSWDYSEFVRGYGNFLVENIKFMVNDEALSMRVVNLSDEVRIERVFSRMECLQRLLERVLAMRPRTVNKHKKLIVVALYPVVEKSFEVYDDVCECLAFLLDLYWGMDYWNVVKSLGTYVTVAKQIDELVEFYAWCKDFGVLMRKEYPVVERISDDLLNTMEKFMKKKASDLKKKDTVPESSISVTVGLNEPVKTPLNAVSEDVVDEFEALINLSDDGDVEEIKEMDDPSEKLSLALFSDGNIQWENVFENSAIVKNGSESETQLENSEIADWELALVESANLLKKQAVVEDPFAASAGVHSPVYAPMKGHEIWQQYENNEREHPISSVQNNGNFAYYDFGAQVTSPYGKAGYSCHPSVWNAGR